MPDRQPTILLGVTGGIAAYKSVELLRALQQRGYDVHVLLTRSAQRFVQPLTFAALTGHPVHTSLWKPSSVITPEAPIEHITLAQRADLLLIAPATARTLARLSLGLADDLLSTVALATTAPLVLAPAMNVNMLRHPATQAHLATLRARGARIVDSGEGYLACGMVGAGRMAEIDRIVEAASQVLQRHSDLQGETILVTAGGTREPLDPVRFLGNRSSGRMGHALAERAMARGARVILVTASPLPEPVGSEVMRVTTSEQMRASVLAALPRATVVIGAAAVSDFRPRHLSPGKLKRSGALTLELEPTPDILREVVDRRTPGTLVIAFAAETENVLENARGKLLSKGVDAVVANDVSSPALGFDVEHNAAVFLSPGKAVDLGEATKLEISDKILDELLGMRSSQSAIAASQRS